MTRLSLSYLFAAAVTLSFLAGCTNLDDIAGPAVLRAQLEQAGTKVAVDGADGKISWTPGDRIAIHVGNAYQTVEVTPGSGAVSVDETVSAKRNYYAVYPAGSALDASYGNDALKVSLPAEYDISDIVANAPGNPGADYSPLPMVAVNDSDNSILHFYHVGGLIRITLSGLKATTQKVRLTFDKDVTGEYLVANPSSANPTISSAGDAANNVVLFTLAADAIGDELAATNIILNVPVPCGTYDSVTIETLDAGGLVENSRVYDSAPIPIFRHHARRLSLGELAFDFAFGTLGNGDDFSPLDPRGTTINYGPHCIARGFVSYKTSDGGTTKQAAPFTLEYSVDEGASWSSTPPAWLTPLASIDMGGSIDGQDIGFTVGPQPDASVDEHHTELAKSSRAQTDFDLSTYNVATGETVARTTANCYVVSGSGTYRFPLVYGNGVKGGSVNESAYRGREGVAGSYRPDDGDVHFLGSFKDHLDQNIYNAGDAKSSPYLTTHLGKAASAFTAVLIWQDADGLVEVDPTIAGTGEDAYLTFSVPSSTITQGNAIVAVLTDEDTDGDGHNDIAWSWHIWVTEDNLLAANPTLSSSIKMMPDNLGWCEGKEEIYLERKCLVRATQTESGIISVGSVTHPYRTIYVPGQAPYYQWGRKDPILGHGKYLSEWSADFRYDYNWSKDYYVDDPYYAPAGDLNPYSPVVYHKATVGEAIQHPFFMYSLRYYTDPDNANWCISDYFNLWSTTIDGADESQNAAAKTKTIYDPSPVGYRVPALEELRNSITMYNTLLKWYHWSKGILTDHVQMFFPFSGYRLGYYHTDTGDDSGFQEVNQTGEFYSSMLHEYTMYGGVGIGYAPYYMQIRETGISFQTGHLNYGLSVRPVEE